MSRIVWTKQEKNDLRASMIDLCYVTPSYSNKGLLQRAQEEAIPYERRQKITDQKAFTYKNMIKEARAVAEKQRQMYINPAPKPEPVPVPMEYAKPSVGELFEQLVDALTERVLLQVTDRLKDRLTGDVSQIAANRLDELFERPMDQIDAMFGTLRPAKPRKPTCLVVGLNGAQMESIKRRVPHVDFKFLTAEDALSHYVSTKDHTILMTKFINHSVQGKYRKHPNLHYCNGGVTELNNLLNGVFK